MQPDDSSCAFTVCVDVRRPNVLVGVRKHLRRYARMQGQAFISVPPISVNTIPAVSVDTIILAASLYAEKRCHFNVSGIVRLLIILIDWHIVCCRSVKLAYIQT